MSSSLNEITKTDRRIEQLKLQVQQQIDLIDCLNQEHYDVTRERRALNLCKFPRNTRAHARARTVDNRFDPRARGKLQARVLPQIFRPATRSSRSASA
jgi:hypothetical protein